MTFTEKNENRVTAFENAAECGNQVNFKLDMY